MKFSEMNAAQMKAAKNDLKKRLDSTLYPSRITQLTDNGVYLEGGVFPAQYDDNAMELMIWGRASRSAGGGMTVHQLAEAEAILIQFYIEYMNEDSDQQRIVSNFLRKEFMTVKTVDGTVDIVVYFQAWEYNSEATAMMSAYTTNADPEIDEYGVYHVNQLDDIHDELLNSVILKYANETTADVDGRRIGVKRVLTEGGNEVMTKNIETEVAEALFDSFTVIFAKGLTERDRQELLYGIQNIDIDGEPVGRVLMGVLVATKALHDNLTGTDMPLSTIAEAFVMLAEIMETGELGGDKTNGGE